MSKDDSEKKSEFLSIRVSKEMKAELEAIAADNERSLSWVVAKIIDRYLESGRSKKF